MLLNPKVLRIPLKEVLILVGISFILIFGLIKLELSGITLSAQSYSLSKNDTVVLTLRNNTFWPIRYQSKCKGQVIKASIAVPNGWKHLSQNDECQSIIFSDVPSSSFDFLWPFQKKEFVFSLSENNFKPGSYIFGIWTDTSLIGNKRSIFYTKFSNLISTTEVKVF